MNGDDVTVASAKPRAALLLGAGYSHVAGLPLVAGLFDLLDAVIPAGSRARYELVHEAFQRFVSVNADSGAEQFLLAASRGQIAIPDCYLSSDFPPWGVRPHYQLRIAEAADSLPWEWAVGAVQIRLAQPDSRPYPGLGDRTARYRPELVRLSHCSAHRQFLKDILVTHDLCGVVTTNYDVLAERMLRVKRGHATAAPLFHYGGVRAEVRLVNSPFARDRAQATTPTGPVPLAKLHGSLNWSCEGGQLTVYPDLRPVWRGGGTAAIVPPLPEKEMPEWLAPVWEAAFISLSRAHQWTVVGYSLPEYDAAVQNLLRAAAEAGNLETIELHDPWPDEIAGRFRRIAPRAQIKVMPGLAHEARRPGSERSLLQTESRPARPPQAPA